MMLVNILIFYRADLLVGFEDFGFAAARLRREVTSLPQCAGRPVRPALSEVTDLLLDALDTLQTLRFSTLFIYNSQRLQNKHC